MQRCRIELLPNQELRLAPSVTLRQKGPGLRARVIERAASAPSVKDVEKFPLPLAGAR